MRFSCRVERPCTAPAEVVYDLLIDVDRWPDWLPGTRSADWDDPGGAGTREDAIRRVVVSGLTMREKVLVADRPHHHAYTILSGIPVADHRADVDIRDKPGGSLIVWRATFRSRIPLAGPLVWVLLRMSMPRMAAALAEGAERRPV
ncbi:SRPBCC family protein [Mycobacterium sp. E2989]|uniref:SRPBCC family protein n=1 Tax=Mycobacterium sp. E2989 TaxID=1834140 RepID=UPI0007FCA703|nr:SRPBCC family protein [Mycobacterium sp. E2989]OBH82902.1 hypothetical protein A5680_13340 [Mycobacterium sp. E2989]